jgi:hypothetical protein
MIYMPQIRLYELLLDIPKDHIQEIWEVSYILPTSTSKPHYIVIFKDSTSLCTCMLIVNQGMPCRHQYRIFLQSAKVIFHLDFIHTRWFEAVPTADIINKIIISQEIQSNLLTLHHIERLMTANVYTATVKETVNKKILKYLTLNIIEQKVNHQKDINHQ